MIKGVIPVNQGWVRINHHGDQYTHIDSILWYTGPVIVIREDGSRDYFDRARDGDFKDVIAVRLAYSYCTDDKEFDDSIGDR